MCCTGWYKCFILVPFHAVLHNLSANAGTIIGIIVTAFSLKSTGSRGNKKLIMTFFFFGSYCVVSQCFLVSKMHLCLESQIETLCTQNSQITCQLRGSRKGSSNLKQHQHSSAFWHKSRLSACLQRYSMRETFVIER